MKLPLFITHPITATKNKWKKLFKKINVIQQYEIRNVYIENLGFPIVTTEVANKLSEFIGTRSVVDIGARTGFISFILKNLGVRISAIDNLTGGKYGCGSSVEVYKWVNIEKQDALEVNLSQYDVILLAGQTTILILDIKLYQK